MEYYFSTRLESSFEEAIGKVTEALKAEGFGVLTDIELNGSLKQKLYTDLNNYRILGACNPRFDYQASATEEKITTMLPCNVIVKERTPGHVEVSAVDPAASMMAVSNKNIGLIAQQTSEKLQRVISNLS